MATQVETRLIDDIAGGDATETITFGIDGVEYEIDLNDKHAEQLRKAIAKFSEHARRIRHRSTPKARKAATPGQANGTTKDGHSSREIRDWARSQGMEVPNTGRVPNVVIEAFEAAHE
jgi:hypothetical protein